MADKKEEKVMNVEKNLEVKKPKGAKGAGEHSTGGVGKKEADKEGSKASLTKKSNGEKVNIEKQTDLRMFLNPKQQNTENNKSVLDSREMRTEDKNGKNDDAMILFEKGEEGEVNGKNKKKGSEDENKNKTPEKENRSTNLDLSYFDDILKVKTSPEHFDEFKKELIKLQKLFVEAIERNCEQNKEALSQVKKECQHEREKEINKIREIVNELKHQATTLKEIVKCAKCENLKKESAAQKKLWEKEREDWQHEKAQLQTTIKLLTEREELSKNDKDANGKPEQKRLHQRSEKDIDRELFAQQDIDEREMDVRMKGTEQSSMSKEGETVNKEKSTKRRWPRNPMPLNKWKLQEELKNRAERRNNICVNCDEREEENRMEEMIQIIAEKLNVSINPSRTKICTKTFFKMAFDTFEEKCNIMRVKGMLKNSDIWLEDDCTAREVEIQKWLRAVADIEKKKGRNVSIGYQKIVIDEE